GTSPLALVQGWITSGYANGLWTGGGITSSSAAGAIGAAHPTALGYTEATDIFFSFPATFVGQPVDNTAVLVRYTLTGDATLDGSIDTTDFNLRAASFGSGGQTWNHGDFNYDSAADTIDFNALASNFAQSLPATPASRAAAAAAPGAASTFSRQL